MMRKMLLAAALSVTAMTAHADYQCSVTPRDDVIVSPQTVQVKGENGNLVITPDGNVGELTAASDIQPLASRPRLKAVPITNPEN
uniref:Uncharacterized protein n=1 Tax=uncultured organism TaxID=155900 RepID=A0A385FVF6_9ZZZZ|nr:hypothetical protein TRI11_00003 [uncultured organism]